MRLRTLCLTLCIFFSASSYSYINVGTLIFNPPFITSPGFRFDMDLARLLCKRLKEQCHFIPMVKNQLYTALQSGKIDIAIGGISISPQVNFIFSLPYMITKGQFLVLKDGPIKSIKNLKGGTVGVFRDQLNGGVFYNYLLSRYNGLFQIQQFTDIQDILAALDSKSIQAAFLHRSVVNYWYREGGNQFKPFESSLLIGDGVAIMALPKNKQLIDQINAQLKYIESNTTFLRLYTDYFSDE